MDKCREEFEKAFSIPAHWIEFDEKANRYYCPYVADATASEYQSKWVVWQRQQEKVEELKRRNQFLSDNVKEMGDKHIRDSDLINQQAEMLGELQKRVDAALQVFEKGRNGCFDIHDLFVEVEQALNGGESK